MAAHGCVIVHCLLSHAIACSIIWKRIMITTRIVGGLLGTAYYVLITPRTVRTRKDDGKCLIHVQLQEGCLGKSATSPRPSRRQSPAWTSARLSQ